MTRRKKQLGYIEEQAETLAATLPEIGSVAGREIMQALAVWLVDPPETDATAAQMAWERLAVDEYGK